MLYNNEYSYNDTTTQDIIIILDITINHSPLHFIHLSKHKWKYTLNVNVLQMYTVYINQSISYDKYCTICTISYDCY